MLSRLRQRIKERIRLKLRLFLGISDLEEKFVNYKDTTGNHLLSHDRSIKWIKNNLKDSNKRIDSLHTTVSNVVSLGAAVVQPYDKSGSWAVVCIEGRYNVVKFVDLRGQHGRDILHFLKQFEASRYVHDAPMGFLPKEMFIDWKK